MTDIVPYTFNTDMVPLVQAQEMQGQNQCVHFTVVDQDSLEMLLDKIRRWFAERDEVILVDHGITAKELGFVVLEWEGYAVDPLFIAILQHEDIVDDYTIYTRDQEA